MLKNNSSTKPVFVRLSLKLHTVFSSGTLSPVAKPKNILKLLLSNI